MFESIVIVRNRRRYHLCHCAILIYSNANGSAIKEGTSHCFNSDFIDTDFRDVKGLDFEAASLRIKILNKGFIAVASIIRFFTYERKRTTSSG